MGCLTHSHTNQTALVPHHLTELAAADGIEDYCWIICCHSCAGMKSSHHLTVFATNEELSSEQEVHGATLVPLLSSTVRFWPLQRAVQILWPFGDLNGARPSTPPSPRGTEEKHLLADIALRTGPFAWLSRLPQESTICACN